MSADAVSYLDSSALVKLVVSEPESAALAEHLRKRPNRATSALARVEVVRAVSVQGEPAVKKARELLGRVSLLRLDDVLLEAAAELGGDYLRSLDAIHIAAARSFGAGLAEMITYDRRMADAAVEMGLPVVTPE